MIWPVSFPVCTFHIRKVLSPPPEMNFDDCQSTSMHQTTPPCPLNVPRRSPFNEYQTLGIGSFDAVKSKSPSLLYLICVMARSCPCNIKGFYKNKEVRIYIWSLLLQPDIKKRHSKSHNTQCKNTLKYYILLTIFIYFNQQCRNILNVTF